MAAQYSVDDGPLSCITSAQAQLDIISRSGRQLLEILACSEEPAVMAERVTSATAAAEEAMAAAKAHITKLEPLMTGVVKEAQPLNGAARRAALDERMVNLHKGGEGNDRLVFEEYVGSGPEVLQAVVQRAKAGKGLPVLLCRRTCPGVRPEQATEVRLVMEGVACAAVALTAAGQPEGVRVALLSPDEASTSDAWQCSAHQVFRRASDVAMGALAHFTERAERARPSTGATPALLRQAVGASALEDLLLWLSAYRTLFSQPCAATGKLLALDMGSNCLLVPVWRSYKSATRAQLLAAATRPDAWPAYHLHAAPVCMSTSV